MKMQSKKVVAYYKISEYGEEVVVDAWDDDNAQYPLLWNNHYILDYDFGLEEVKNMVYEKCKKKLKNKPFIFIWEKKR